MINTYKPQNKAICHMSDYELVDLLENCSEMFGSKLTEKSIPAFKIILDSRFRMKTDKQIFDLCLSYASNPSSQMERFTPRVLSGLLIAERSHVSSDYKQYEPSNDTKAQIKQQWLCDLYKGFEDYCDKREVKTIHVWNYLAQKLVDAGILFPEELKQARVINETRSKQRQEFSMIGLNFENGYKALCLGAFHDLAMQGKHIKEFVK